MADSEVKSSSSYTQLAVIDKLKGTSNYVQWKQDMQDFFEMHNLWSYFTTARAAPANGSAATRTTWMRTATQILAMLRGRCEPTPRSKIE